MKKPMLTNCVTFKFTHSVAKFFSEMSDTFANCSYKMDVDSTGSAVIVKITCNSVLADVLVDTFSEEFNGWAKVTNCPLAGIK